jgi:hypothetical protein
MGRYEEIQSTPDASILRWVSLLVALIFVFYS